MEQENKTQVELQAKSQLEGEVAETAGLSTTNNSGIISYYYSAPIAVEKFGIRIAKKINDKARKILDITGEQNDNNHS